LIQNIGLFYFGLLTRSTNKGYLRLIISTEKMLYGPDSTPTTPEEWRGVPVERRLKVGTVDTPVIIMVHGTRQNVT
jgi:hypothetical protein